MSPDELDILRRRADRDRRARERAEQLLEAKARQLFDANERLRLATRGRLESLARVGEELGRLQDLDILVNRILLEARQMTGASAGLVHMREEHDLVAAYRQNDAAEPPAMSASGLRRAISMQTIEGSVALTGIHANLTDAARIPENLPYREEHELAPLLGTEPGATLCVAIRSSGGDAVAVLQLVHRRAAVGETARVFDHDDEILMRHFATLAGVAMERARLTRSIINRMIRAVELRDPFETSHHAVRVADLSVELWRSWAERSTVHPTEIERSADRLRIAAMLHDVGRSA